MCGNSCSCFCTREKLKWRSFTCLILLGFLNRKWENTHRKKGGTERQVLADQRGSNQTLLLLASWLTLLTVFTVFSVLCLGAFLIEISISEHGIFYMGLLKWHFHSTSYNCAQLSVHMLPNVSSENKFSLGFSFLIRVFYFHLFFWLFITSKRFLLAARCYKIQCWCHRSTTK